jgi:hypothetical protein
MKKTTPTLAVLLAALAGCSAGERMEESAPAQARESGGASPSSVVVSVDVGSRTLGAYELVLHYDPAVVAVREIRPVPNAAGGFPMTDRSTYRSGATPIVGLGLELSGRIDVAWVELQGLKAGESSLSVSVRTLVTSDGKPVPGTALVSEPRVRVR